MDSTRCSVMVAGDTVKGVWMHNWPQCDMFVLRRNFVSPVGAFGKTYCLMRLI